jgi:hypothetical protein
MVKLAVAVVRMCFPLAQRLMVVLSVMLVMVVLRVFVEPLLLLQTLVVRGTILKVAAISQVWQQRFLLYYYQPY